MISPLTFHRIRVSGTARNYPVPALTSCSPLFTLTGNLTLTDAQVYALLYMGLSVKVQDVTQAPYRIGR